MEAYLRDHHANQVLVTQQVDDNNDLTVTTMAEQKSEAQQ